MQSKFEIFAALHVPGDPVILYNIWDVGSAHAVVQPAPTRWPREAIPSPMPMGGPTGNKCRSISRSPTPSASSTPSSSRSRSISRVPTQAIPKKADATSRVWQATGAVGCNFEDQVVGGDGLHPLTCSAAGSRRSAAPSAIDFFINARTDLFLKTQTYDDALIDQVIERGKAFADSGASGFFVPRLADPKQIERVVREVPLPLNVIAFPGAPDKSVWANAGVARISHGPFPHRALMKQFEEMARTAIS